MDMFTEVGSIALLQDNAEEQIYEKYKELYQEDKGCHYLVYENDTVIACGGAVIIKLKPSATGRQLYEKFGFYDSGEMELWLS